LWLDMSVFITSLNSGSNGNCYYIGNEHEAVLIDAGLSCRETETRMKRLGLNMRKVKAVFISHEHSDHIRGVEVLSKKHRLQVYVTRPTLQHGGLVLDEELAMEFEADKSITIGNLLITPFLKIHDAAHPHSFTIACDAIKIGVFTDIGMVCENLVNHFQQCHAAFLEANYEEELLEKGSYPFHLKRRISGGRGHLSNKQALALFIDYRPSFMTHLFLSHLSKDNNDPALVHSLFYNHSRGTEIIVASRYHETPVYHINKALQIAATSGYVQTSLF
jgi:phosphoribosyl 1,2-cyclic phosphodiesterase